MTDQELEQLLLDAGLTKDEISRMRAGFPELKIVVECLTSFIAGRIAQQAIDKFLSEPK